MFSIFHAGVSLLLQKGMKNMNVAINGFGRIGRTFLRTVLLDELSAKKLNIVAINVGPGDLECTGVMFKYDSIMGIFPGSVSCDGKNLIVNDRAIPLISQEEAQACEWGARAVEWVVESSGYFTSRQKAQKHIDAGAKRVLISAPGKNEDVTIIPGINDKAYEPSKHTVVALGSCTTNCFAPMVKVLDESFTIKNGLMTTVHSYTNTQVLLDKADGDLRRSRAAALNIIPTGTGAGDVIFKIFPHLKGKLGAMALRVPTPNVSLVDFTCMLEKPCSIDKVNDAFKQAAEGPLKGILEYCTLPLVSSDFMGNDHSCIFDAQLTQASGNLVKVFGWYDNEWGYSQRLKDFLLHNS
jgi:glyceraldehyde 3-phosphate dehydrogenase